MQVLAHPDPFVLEAELLDRVAAAQADDALVPVLIVVPTLALARHASRRIAEQSGARLAIEILDHRTLAWRALDAGGAAPLRVASAAMVGELVDRSVAALRDGALRRFLDARPGARRALADTLRELREAGIDPDALARALPREDRELADAFTSYARELARLALRGMTDEAGLVAAALPHVGRFAARFGAILHHGAYELIGVHLDLVRALDAVSPVTFLLPCEPGGAAARTATTFAQGFLSAGESAVRRLGDRAGSLLGGRLASLYDEGATPPALPADALRLHHAQGARAELRLAARLALRAIATDGVPPHEIVIVARTLTPYAAAIEDVLDAEGIPWSGSLDAPLRRQPLIHDLVLLLRVVAEDFPRRSTAELLASPRFHWSRLLPSQAAPAGDLAEAWSRGAGILGGLDSWRRDLPAWAGSRREDPDPADEAGAATRALARRSEATRMVDALVALAHEAEPGRKRRWSAHAARIERLLDGCLVPVPGEPERAALTSILADMRDLEGVLGDAREVSFGAMIERFEGWVDEARLPLRPRDEGGVRVLDAMQARGLTFRRVFLLGMHAGLFPRTPRADPFLDDATRGELRRTTGRPIARKLDAEHEERALLSLLLGSCGEALAISWQRSEDSGKARTPSIALREVARVTLGAADLELLVRCAARGIPVHPEQALDRLRHETDMLSPDDAALLVALRSSDPDRALALLGDRARGLEAGLALLAATERAFAPDDARYDGGCAPLIQSDAVSVTALELLGRCPLRYFFRHLLRVRELEEEAGPFDVDSREMGIRAHRVLQRTFESLFRDGLLEAGREAEARRRAEPLVAEIWSTVNEDLRRQLDAAPVLWSHLCDVWVPSLVAFVESESVRLVALGVGSLETEVVRRVQLDFGRGAVLPVVARFDRFMRVGAEEVLVSDYKTGRELAKHVSSSRALKGLELQAPLYHEMAGANASIELLGVGPLHARAADDARRAVFDGFAGPEEVDSFRETMRVLLALPAVGRFPIRPEPRHCAHCPYHRACRYNHPPTIQRHENSPGLTEFYALESKSTRKFKPS